MSRPSIYGSIVGAIVGPLLFWALLAKTGLGLAEVGRLFGGLRPIPTLIVGAATALSVALAGEKWRLVEARLSGAAPPRRRAIGLSALGSALGQFLPPPVASALVRGAGNHLDSGQGARRGALASVWEQLFDIGVIAILTAPAIIALLARQPLLYLVLAPATAILADRLMAPAARLATRLAPSAALLLDPALCLALYRLSVAKFALLTVMTLGVALAIGSSAPLGPLAGAIPLVALAATASFLPGGLGVNEWSFVLILGVWGAPAATIVAFALMNRLLVASFSLAFGVAAIVLMRRRGSDAVPIKAYVRQS